MRVVPQPVTPERSDEPALQRALHHLNTAGEPSTKIVRRYRESPSPLVPDTRTSTRTGRLVQVLSGDFDLIG